MAKHPETMRTYRRMDGKDIGEYSVVMDPEWFDEDEEGAWVTCTEWLEVKSTKLWLGPKITEWCKTCGAIGELRGPFRLKPNGQWWGRAVPCVVCGGEGHKMVVPPMPEPKV